jgi:hypothetical protein
VRFDSMATFGTLLARAIFVALAADFLLMPALVMTLQPFGPERPEASQLESARPMIHCDE